MPTSEWVYDDGTESTSEEVAFCLRAVDGSSTNAFGRAMGIRWTQANDWVDYLQERGLVERGSMTGGAWRWHLTPKGRRLLKAQVEEDESGHD